MNCELVTATTADLVRLQGLYFNATGESGGSIDAAVILHGLGGNFYSSRLSFRLSQALTEIGISTCVVNTRGHDGISTSTVSGRVSTTGAAFEIVADCQHDVRGWVDWLIQRGHRRIALVGHSLGAIKSLFAQAFAPHDHVKAIVALSASRLCHQSFLDSDRREQFLGWYDRATEMVKQGKGDELLNVDFPFPTYICAKAYADKYGPADQYNWLTFVSQVDVPLLMIFGERELIDNAAFQGVLEDLEPIRATMQNMSVTVVESADHFYSGVHHSAGEAMTNWLSAL